MTRSRAPHAAPKSPLSASEASSRPTTSPDPREALTEPLSASVAMTDAEAAEIRERAWTRLMRKQYEASPGYVLRCACQRGRSSWCAREQCGQCQPPDPAASVSWETLICDRSGLSPVFFAEPFHHPTPSLTGPRCERMAMVWLADRMCRWTCECPHHQQDAPAPVPAPRAPVYELVPLFDLA